MTVRLPAATRTSTPRSGGGCAHPPAARTDPAGQPGYEHLGGHPVPADLRAERHRIAAAWPATGDGPGALEDAVAEAWTGWSAREVIWTGAGTDLVTGTLPAGAAVVGLWWD